MTRWVAVTGEMGGLGDVSLSSWTSSGKGKLMGSGYPFVDGKKYSGASAKYKAQPQSFACKLWIKRFSSLTQTNNFYSMFYSGGEQKCQNFITQCVVVRHKINGKPLTSIELGMDATGGWLWPSLTYTKASITFHSLGLTLLSPFVLVKSMYKYNLQMHKITKLVNSQMHTRPSLTKPHSYTWGSRSSMF